MKKLAVLTFAALMAVQVAVADDLKSGLQPGDSVGAFTVEKVAGNPNDNVAVGKNLCYRCMLGNRPVVMVFARKPNESLAGLVEKLDAELPKHKEKKLASFVNLIGSEDTKSLKEAAKAFGEKNKPENIAIVVPEDSVNGPETFGISPDAEVTVIIYQNGKVAANHAFGPDKLDEQGITAIITDATKMIN